MRDVSHALYWHLTPHASPLLEVLKGELAGPIFCKRILFYSLTQEINWSVENEMGVSEWTLEVADVIVGMIWNDGGRSMSRHVVKLWPLTSFACMKK